MVTETEKKKSDANMEKWTDPYITIFFLAAKIEIYFPLCVYTEMPTLYKV